MANELNEHKIDLHREPVEPRLVNSRASYVIAVMLIVLWLIPMLMRGMTGKSVARVIEVRSNTLPARAVRRTLVTADYMYNIACLFTHIVNAWGAQYVQGLRGDSDQWVELHDSQYSPMKPFGHRARVDRLIVNNANYYSMSLSSNMRDRAHRQMKEMALWYRNRHAQLNPGAPPLRAVRFVQVSYPTGGEIATPPGYWRKHPTDQIPIDRLGVIEEIYFDE